MKRITLVGLVLLIAAVASDRLAAQTTPPPAPAFRIGKIAMAITKVDAMVDFYRTVFGIDFKAIEVSGQKLYTGMFAGQTLLLVPNTLANVKADQSRVQFDIIVPDLKSLKEKALAHGGQVREENSGDSRSIATVVDPDGNTIVLVQEK